MASPNLIRLYIIAKLMIRCISISFLVRRRSITTTVSSIPGGNATITTGWGSNHVIIEINAITGEFVR